MSRVGNQSIAVPDKVKVSIADNHVAVVTNSFIIRAVPLPAHADPDVWLMSTQQVEASHRGQVSLGDAKTLASG